MPYCPQCRREYLKGAKYCPQCKIRLVRSLPPPAAETAKPSEMVLLHSFPGRVYAEMVQEALKNQGIPSLIKGEDVGIGVYWGAHTVTEVKLYVPKDSYEEALNILNLTVDHI